MSLTEEVEALRNITLFSSLDESKLKLLAFTSEWITYQADEVLCKEGEKGEDAYVIMEGDVDIYVDSGDGQLLVTSHGAGEIVGETAIVCDVPRTATVVARNELVVLKITKDVFMQLLEGCPEVAIAVIRELALRVNDGVRMALRGSG
ncbi:hypothetical protein AB833_21275 [Chromatiales bacterium (ex Bugula neritina AB1)]|nr:hypothetical protein AB833_21275 [Chromatiales bacterium (ex Bugula neritina AB1)]